MDDNTTDTVLDHIAVRIDDPPLDYVLACLNLEDPLSMTRERLVQNTKVKMSDTLSFAKKIDQTNSTLARIAKEDEGNIILKDIIEVQQVGNKILYLKSDPDWKFLNYKCKIDCGRTIDLDKANKRAFTMEDCEMTEVVEVQNDIKKIESIEDIVKANLYLTVENNMQDFAKLRVLVENFKKSTANHTYNIIEGSKASLKFKELKPTEEFVNEVKVVIESKDPRKFKDITKEFGQFIPKEVILGGRALLKGLNIQSKNSKEGVINESGRQMTVRGKWMAMFKILIKSNSEQEGFKLVGGEQSSFKNFDEQAWIESLKDFRNWDCIKFKNPISIFQPLPKDLRQQILKLIGKKILYTNIEDYSYKLSKPETHQTFELKNIPENILEILRNEDAECNIFATVVCTKKAKGDVFNCQILCPPNEDPKLIIHCIQNEFKKRECKLKIRLMIIGYDINFNFNRPTMNVHEHEFNASDCQSFELDLEDSTALCFGTPVLRKLDSSNNSLIIGHYFLKDEKRISLYVFSYCSKNKHYVNLPDFTFYTLILSNYSNPNDSGIIPFKRYNLKHKVISQFKPNTLPKYISLYSIGKSNCGPIFLKQRINEIKYIVTTDCDRDDCICKNNNKKNMEYAFFNPDPVSHLQ